MLGSATAETSATVRREQPASFCQLGFATYEPTAVTAAYWTDRHDYRPSYVLCGLLGILWLVVPTVYAFAAGKDPPFPTLFRTVANLEEWLRSRPWRWNLGPLAGWVVAYVVLTGLVILLLHLTLYPYPDITHILNPNG